jgi:DNA transformation protein
MTATKKNMTGNNLSSVINIGKDTQSKLKQVGIDSIEMLRAAGTEQTFLRLQTIDPGACLSLLYGIDGAISGIKWNELSTERKHQLKEFYQLAKKSIR